ncbi:phospholipid/cholesterol/gamma-HCH transport system substrate-binding protein [Flavobacterium aquaticum]|uniref:Phospholipid/cholesterol/gamma-HCH transport system substrate-binding protein n=1 Tax=Flavobacterium aquaticum TaxID=1236486 RepID=A0A327YJZ8_9FLAO|nr:MlaD family protein [Flavobacterium aquaticum]RAK20722.1 phospholipid/cholesterol/gamma-HCH transport system substrate-binding protein [Flavobacterium aquaticum]
MEKSNSQKIQLGIFVIIGTLVFLAAIYFIGNKQNMFGNTSHLKAVFVNVNGLQPGNNVRYAGIDIGTVKEIEMINDTTISVHMIIDNKIMEHIKKNAIATISSDGLVGNMIINIIPGKGATQKVENGDTIQSYSRIGTDAMLETLNVTNENAAMLTADLLKITQEITQGNGTVGLLIRDTLMAQDLKATMSYLRQTSKGTSESVANLNKLITDLNRKDNVIGTLNDTVVANRMKKIIINLEKSSNEIDKVVTNLNATITNVKDGKGAINYLSNDPKLVKQIDSTITNINKASIKLNEDLEALKHNFLFRGYFKKQEKEKAKKKTN